MADQPLSKRLSGITTQGTKRSKQQTASEARKADLISGAQLGESVLGPEGLGRVRDEKIVGIEGRLEDLSQGFSAQEMQARREQALQGISQGASTQSRALQAALARSGVKGGAAGEQVAGLQLEAVRQRGSVERDLLIADREARTQGLAQLSNFATGTRQFDLGQAAKEKNVALQSSLGMAQIGQAERSGAAQADAARRAAEAMAAAQGGGGLLGGGKSIGKKYGRYALATGTFGASEVFCFTEGSLIELANGTSKKIQDLEIGEELALGGKLLCVGKAFPDDELFDYRGATVTGSHAIYENGKWITTRESKEASLAKDQDTLVYPLVTENHLIVSNGFISADVLEIDNHKDQEYNLTVLNSMDERNTILSNYLEKLGALIA